MSADSSAAVFLDRDGVINELVRDQSLGTSESPYRPEDVELKAGTAGAIERLAKSGYVLVVVSNQPAAAKGVATAQALGAVHDRVVELLGPAASSISRWIYCRHHPRALDPRLRKCDCRKPAPGMLLAAAGALNLDLHRSWAVGDAETDVEAGLAAGCRTVLIADPRSAHRRREPTQADLQVSDLPIAVDAIRNCR